MDKSPNPKAPDEKKIESMLSHIQPQPSRRFYSKVKNAPWMEAAPRSMIHIKLERKMIWGLAAFLVILALVGISFVPPVRAIARQVFFSFLQAPSNQLEIRVTSSNPADLENFADTANFPLSISLAEQQAGFDVKELRVLPKGLGFIGARFDPSYEAVIILYQADGYILFLTQRMVGNGTDVFSVGASAQINLVKIGDYQGEYVAGGWKAISTQATPNPSTSGTQTNISAMWDSNQPQYTLRWLADGYIYEIRAMGEGSPSQSQLISLANELK